VHRPEQQAAFDEHALPIVAQAALRAAHAPLRQVWLQQSPLALHGRPSDWHCG
jgi:hypothetical protein